FSSCTSLSLHFNHSRQYRHSRILQHHWRTLCAESLKPVQSVQVSTQFSDPNPRGLEHLSPAFPGRAPWGTAERLRAWQQEAIQQYFSSPKHDYLVAATPGAGKTTFALRLAKQLLDERTVNRLVVVAPTEHLKYQWA